MNLKNLELLRARCPIRTLILQSTTFTSRGTNPGGIHMTLGGLSVPTVVIPVLPAKCVQHEQRLAKTVASTITSQKFVINQKILSNKNLE